MNTQRSISLFILMSLITVSELGFANPGLYGAGILPGAPYCPYPYRTARTSDDALTRTKEELGDIDSDIKDLEYDLGQYESDIESVVGKDLTAVIVKFIDSKKRCGEFYDDTGRLPGKDDDQFKKDATTGNAKCEWVKDTTDGRYKINKVDANACTANYSDPMPPRAKWDAICSGSEIKKELCDLNSNSSGNDRSVYSEYRRDCRNALKKYQDTLKQIEKAKIKYEKLEKDVQRLEQKAEYERHRSERRGKIDTCINCYALGRSRSPSLRDTAIAGVMDLIGFSYNRSIQNHAIDRASEQGWAFQPSPSFGYGYPYALASLYGATYSGVGAGGFGCGAGIGGAGFGMGPYGGYGPFGLSGGLYGNMGGPFGYPGAGCLYPGMCPGMGGNMYLPGMGPWGMNGPYGGMGGMGGMMGGYPMMGGSYPMMGGPYGGMALGGFLSAGVGMIPGGMGMAGGLGGMAMLGGYAFQGGYPGAGMGMMPGGMGMMPGGMGMVPGGMGMVPGGMGMVPGGMGMAGGLGADFYQRLMQQQMQQYQLYAEAQKRYFENQQSQMRVVGSLQSELYSLQMKLQQAYMGMYGSAYYGVGGGFSGGFGGGVGGGFYPTYPGPVPGGAGGRPVGR